MASGSTSRNTIFALSSAAGRAGVAVVRVSGTDTRLAVKMMAGDVPRARTAALRSFRDPATGEEIDRGLLIFFPGPGSFTGEDLAEFQVHGGRAVVAALLAALGRIEGCRPAEPGEFAMRAFHNGKLDLAQAEGLADLIDAETEAQRRQAVRQAAGALSGQCETWRDRLISAMALMEAAIDFSDEGDVAQDAVSQAEGIARELEAEIRAHLSDGHRGEILRDGFKVVLAGAPNVGKSSLLNALARRDVAIVSSEAGTTRDVVEVRLDLDGLPVIVSDTAGLRAEASGDIEREGMRRTRERAGAADLVVWVMDDAADAGPPVVVETAELLDGGQAEELRVQNKVDLLADAGAASDAMDDRGHFLRVSAKTGAGLAVLTHRIAVIAKARIEGGTGEAALITQARHRTHLESCVQYLGASLEAGKDVELRAEDLRLAATSLGRISGRVDAEDVLDQVFGRFCIGK